MPVLSGEEIARLRAAIASTSPTWSADQIEALLEAVRRQHEDSADHDRSLIAERLRLTPEQRLREMQDLPAFIEAAKHP